MRITPWFIVDILIMLLLSFGTMILFNILNIYYLRKYNTNKWLLLGISIASIILSQVLQYNGYHIALVILTMLLGVFFLVWFFDIHKNRNNKNTSKNEKKIVMKPKAKPNRAKRLNEKKDNKNKSL